MYVCPLPGCVCSFRMLKTNWQFSDFNVSDFNFLLILSQTTDISVATAQRFAYQIARSFPVSLTPAYTNPPSHPRRWRLELSTHFPVWTESAIPTENESRVIQEVA